MKARFDKTLLIVLCVGFADYVGIGLVYPIFSVMMFDPSFELVSPDTSFAARGALLGVLFSLGPFSQFFTSQLFGVYSDIKGRRIALLLGIAIGCIGYAIAIAGIWMSSLALIILATILSGISDSTASVAQAVVADISSDKDKARNFGYFNSSLGFGYTIGPFIGGKLTDTECCPWAGYALPFMAAGAMMFMNLLLVWWEFKETHHSKEHQDFKFFKQIQDLSRALKFKNLKWVFLGGFAFSSGWSFFNEFVPVLWMERFDFSASDIGNFYGYSGLWYALGAAFFVTPLLKYMRPEKIIVVASAACAFALAFLSLVHNSVYIWVLTPFVMILLAIGFPVATTVVSNRSSDDCQGEVLGIFQAIQALAMGLIPLIFGGLVGLYPVASVWGAVVSMIVAGLAFGTSPRRKKRLKI